MNERAVKLLRQVQEELTAEPKRFSMATWLRTPFNDDTTPACGTVGCVAGWVVILAKQETMRRNSQETGALPVPSIRDIARDAILDNKSVPVLARQELDLTPQQGERLFHIENWPSLYKSNYRFAKDARGRVEAMVSRINQFINSDGRY